jgi:hypothetical protein
VRYLLTIEIDHLRGFIDEWFHLAHVPKGREGTFPRVQCHSVAVVRKAKPGYVIPDEPLPNQCINKCPDVISGFLGYAVIVPAGLCKETIYGALPVKELPQVSAGGVQAKATTGIGVEENRPVVKLLAEHDERVGYGSAVVFHRSAITILLDLTMFHAIGVPEMGCAQFCSTGRTSYPAERFT